MLIFFSLLACMPAYFLVLCSG